VDFSDCKFFDYGLILEKLRGLSAKCLKLDFSGIVFLKITRGPPEPRSKVDRPWKAAPSSPELQPPAAPVSTGVGQGAGEEDWGHGECDGRLTGARAVGWRPSVTAARWRSEKFDGEVFRHGREGRSVVRCGVLRGSSGGFYRDGRAPEGWPK
jgi:hypothetical protein